MNVHVLGCLEEMDRRRFAATTALGALVAYAVSVAGLRDASRDPLLLKAVTMAVVLAVSAAMVWQVVLYLSAAWEAASDVGEDPVFWCAVCVAASFAMLYGMFVVRRLLWEKARGRRAPLFG